MTGGTVESAHLTVRVHRIEWKCEGVLEFVLAGVDGHALPSSCPGAHIDVHVPGAGIRQYSLLNPDAGGNRYRIAVRKDLSGRGGSRAMHEQVRVGDILTISPPRNLFPLDQEAAYYWLVAGGIGITPLLAMANTLQTLGKPFHLHYCTREAALTPFREEIEAASWRPDVSFIHDAGDPRRGLDVAQLMSGWTPGIQVYACGPAPMLDALLAAGSGLPDGAVRFERFSAPAAEALGADGSQFMVRIFSTGLEIAVPPDKTVLECLREAGVEVETSCEQGVCGTCRVGVLSGVPEHHCYVLTPQERQANDQMMVCVSRARAGEELVLDL